MSTEYCKHTCPAVDAELADLLIDVFRVLNDADVDSRIIDAVEDMIKASAERTKEVGTYLLRDALDRCYSDLEDEREKVSRLEDELCSSNSRIEDLESEVRQLEDTISEMEQ